MSDGTLLLDRAYFEGSEWRNQAKDQFGRGAAWIDLLGLTNQQPATMEPRGLRIPIERGQCGWSMKGLADRWGWGRGKVAAQLEAWEKIGRITRETNNETTIITIINYDNYQIGLLDLIPKKPADDPQTGSKSSADRQHIDHKSTQRREKGEGITEGDPREKGEGRGAEPTPPTIIPSDEDVRNFCEAWPGDISRGIPTGIPEVWWSGWVSHRLLDQKKWPADWQRVLVLAFRADFLARHPKALGNLPGVNGKKNTATGNTGRSVAQERFLLEKELEAVQERLDALHEIGAEPDALDALREKELEARLSQLEATT